MRPSAPRQSQLWSRPRGRAIVRAAFAVVIAVAVGPLACASAPGSPARRNEEAAPPFASAPDFSLPDADGKPRTLSSLMGPKGLVLVLYRGHW